MKSKVEMERLKIKISRLSFWVSGFMGFWLFFGCDNYYKNDYKDNSPTSGKLKVYYSEGLQFHVKNQAATFLSQYHSAEIECKTSCENEIINALLNDSCKAIVISRLLGANEKKVFEQKNLFPMHSALAKSGVALITSVNTNIKKINLEQIKQLLTTELTLKDSLGNLISPLAVIDNKCSSVAYYLLDSLIQAPKFGPKCFATNNTAELLQKISEQANQIGFIDFAWLSDRDDSLYKAYENKIKFIAVGKTDTAFYAPNQSSFKTGLYPLTRTIYLLRRSDEFSLAKGFESFMAGPKGQLIFLKQGLLPVKQGERVIEVKMEPISQ